VTSFVESLPTLAPSVLEYILDDAGDVVSVVDIIAKPAEALSGIEVILSDIISLGAVASAVTSIGGEIGCFFAGDDCSETADPSASFMSSCIAIKAAATTTYVPVQSSMTVTRPPAVITSIIDTPPTETSQIVTPAATSSTAARTTAPPSSR
jgi:hypothetical protein